MGRVLFNLDDVDLESSFLDGMLSGRPAAPNQENITASAATVILVERITNRLRTIERICDSISNHF